MPDLIIITDKWSEQPWFSTGGTRAKKYLQSPDGRFYYFKRSQYKNPTESKPGKDFKFEFWNEIIAYEFGTMLGFKMLRYDIAIDGEIMGCISESMINSEEQELIEGVKYLQAFSQGYDPTKKEHQSWYTFDMICNALKFSKLQEHIQDVIEVIIFDSLIGNGDRHQENWALIETQYLIPEMLEELEKDEEFNKLSRFKKWLLRRVKETLKYRSEKLKKQNIPLPKLYYDSILDFAPIYDSGSSLGRELTEERVSQLLASEDELNKYIDKGLSEIHWNGNKLNHFNLIKEIAASGYKKTVADVRNRAAAMFDREKLRQIIISLDEIVPESHHSYKIPPERKELIFKIITLRFERLMQLKNERI